MRVSFEISIVFLFVVIIIILLHCDVDFWHIFTLTLKAHSLDQAALSFSLNPFMPHTYIHSFFILLFFIFIYLFIFLLFSFFLLFCLFVLFMFICLFMFMGLSPVLHLYFRIFYFYTVDLWVLINLKHRKKTHSLHRCPLLPFHDTGGWCRKDSASFIPHRKWEWNIFTRAIFKSASMLHYISL